MAIEGLEILQYLVTFSFSLTLRAPLSVVGIVLALNALVAPVAALDGTAMLLNSSAAILGSLVGGYLGWILQSPPFVKPRDMLLDRIRAWRMLAIGALLVGSLLVWVLLSTRFLHWSMSMLAYACTIVLSACTFRMGRSMRYHAAAVCVMHFWWAVFGLGAMLALGLSTSLLLQRGWRDTYPVAVMIVAGAQLAALALLDFVFPSVLPHAPPSPLPESDLLADTIDSVESQDAHDLLSQHLELQE